MEFFKEILIDILSKEEIHMEITFPHLKLGVTESVEMHCYHALLKIKAIIENDSLDDFDCVEKIVCVLEEFGSNGGNRHDFG